MGFYLRKSFSAGPLRLNLSRSGLGASFGVKGARIGTSPRGNYVHVGRGGLYYRARINDGSQPQPAANPYSPQQTAEQANMREIESTDAAQMVDETAADLLKELNRVQTRTELFPIFLVIVLAFGLLFSAFVWPLVIAIVFGIPLLLYLRHLDVTKGTVILNYDIESDVAKSFEQFTGAAEQLSQSGGQWNIEAEGDVANWKTAAGANTQVRRTAIKALLGAPRRVVSNIKVPVLPAGKQTLYFFPERVLVYEKKKVGAVSYRDLQVGSSQTRFVEEEKVPHDAQVVDTTWKYVNKKGGPDKRFKDNREIPITLYGEMRLTSASGLNEVFQFSVPQKVATFLSALEEMKKLKVS